VSPTSCVRFQERTQGRYLFLCVLLPCLVTALEEVAAVVAWPLVHATHSSHS
jgi:hypothetical protein